MKETKNLWYISKTPEGRKQEASAIIYSLLPVDGSEQTWSQLKEAAERQKISQVTLTSHLKKYVELRLARRRVDTFQYPPSVYYSRVDAHLLPKNFTPFLWLALQLHPVTDIVKKKKSRKIYEAGLQVHARYAAAAIPALLYMLLEAKAVQKEKQTPDGNQLFPLDPHAVLNEALDGIFRPWMHAVLDFFSIFPDEAKHELDNVTSLCLTEAAQRLEIYNDRVKPFKRQIDSYWQCPRALRVAKTNPSNV